MCGSTPNVSVTDRTLIIGSTGFIGRFVAETSLDDGRPTYLLVRSGPTCPSKASTIKSLQERGAIVIHGSIEDRDSMEKVLKEHKIEVVISVVGGAHISAQLSLIEAIKAVGTVKRFLPSEFGHDIDRTDPVEPGLALYNEKRKVRRSTEASGIPYTYICCNSIAAWPYHDNHHPADVFPPLDSFHVYGDGTVKAYFVAGADIGKFTIKSIDDDRTLNKTIHFRPSSNMLNINELASLWEDKIGRKLPRITISEDDLLVAAKEMRIPQSIVAALTHDIFINGCQVNYSMDKPTDIEVGTLYPDTPFRTIDECFKDFAGKISDISKAVDKPKSNDAKDFAGKISDISKAVDKPLSNDAIIVPNSKPEALAVSAA
ncbi:leucoanthocyanidin reductase-like [Fagus crenata]